MTSPARWIAGAAIAVLLGCGARRGPSMTAPGPAASSSDVRPAADARSRAGREASSSAPSPSASEPRLPRAILVTIDGVRWQDVFEGADPTLYNRGALGDLVRPDGLMPRTWEYVARGGVALGHGAGCGIVRPRNATRISLPGYLEIFTGRRTPCMSNVCPQVAFPTVLDAADTAGLTVASISSWEMISAAASRRGGRVFVSAGTRWPGPRPSRDGELEHAVKAGESARPFPAPGGAYRPDRMTSAIALEYLRVHRPRLLHVGLGDTDEYGHRDDYASYLGALRDADAFLGDLGEALESMDLLASTTVIVTSDHGRASGFRDHGPSYPESGRSFVVAFGGRVTAQGEACASTDLWLTDIAATLRVLLDLPLDASSEATGRPIEEIVGR